MKIIFNKKIIYDVHENVSAAILQRAYIPYVFRGIISFLYRNLEVFSTSYYDAIISATDSIQKNFIHVRNRVTINNYPTLNGLEKINLTVKKNNEITYVGLINEERGIIPLINAMSIIKTNTKLNLCGRFNKKSTREKVIQFKTDLTGKLDFKIPDMGFVYIQIDTFKKEGYTLFCFEDHFP